MGRYRFEFNGQEKSDEIKGEGNSYMAEFWEYDPRTGRRWNLDPRPKVRESSYVTFANNPIMFSDPFGDTTYRFNKNGTFVESADLNEKGIRGSVGAYQNFTDAGGSRFKGWVSEKSFSFNDLSIDRKPLQELKSGKIGISFLSDANLSWIMNRSRVEKMNFISRMDFAYYESDGARMDFNGNYTLPIRGLSKDADGEVMQNDLLGALYYLMEVTLLTI